MNADRFTPFFNFVVDLLRQRHTSVFWGDSLISLDKSAAFLRDPEFAAVLNEIRGSVQYENYSAPDTIAWRLHTLVWAARRALTLPGDFVEYGTYRGDMALVIIKTTSFHEQPRKFYLYDSFAGFHPTLAKPNALNPGHMEFANKIFSEPDIYPRICERFAGYRNVVIRKGYLPGTLADGAPEKIAFLHLDLGSGVNSSVIELACLDVLFDRLVPGASVVFDDYGWAMYEPQRLALDEYFGARDGAILELPTGQGLYIKPPSAERPKRGFFSR